MLITPTTVKDKDNQKQMNNNEHNVDALYS